MKITLKLLEKTLKYSSLFFNTSSTDNEGEYYVESADGGYLVSLTKNSDGTDILKTTLVSDYSDYTEEELDDALEEFNIDMEGCVISRDEQTILFTTCSVLEKIVNLRKYLEFTTEDLADVNGRFASFMDGDDGMDYRYDDEPDYADDFFDDMMTMDDIYDATEEDVLEDLEFYRQTKTNDIELLDLMCSRFSWADEDEELIDALVPYWEEYTKKRSSTKDAKKQKEYALWFCHQCSREIFYTEDEYWAAANETIDEDLVMEIFAKATTIIDKEREHFKSTGKADPNFAKKICNEFEIEDENDLYSIDELYHLYNDDRTGEDDLDVLEYLNEKFETSLAFFIYDCLSVDDEEETEDFN